MDGRQRHAGVDADRLGFERIEAMIRSLPAAAHEQAGRWERGLLLAGLAAAVLAVTVRQIVPGAAGAVLVLVCVVIELVTLGISSWLSVRRHWPSFRHPTRTFAHELDADFVHYRRLVAALRRFPHAQLEARLRYLRTRRQSMQQGLSLFTGGLERLGILPVIGVLYLQFRDWRWGDWTRLSDVNLLQALLIGALLLVYLTGWQLAIVHRRTAVYEALLAEAAHVREAGISPVPSRPGAAAPVGADVA
ncbi:MAG TPA: hypothetical protein VMR06_03460 [Dokdonella sp.]|uniref:hypothetical protein n=1 Tax=Dokdonella sp. TaxID=2291710 RepID=UPI002CA19A8D|nr:hypothetical protein [Dokdonella sp.]HUD41035.1 hypothetical protein [Dokdonella sp.]